MNTRIPPQGEVNPFVVDSLPTDVELEPVEMTDKGFIISHSESGHHHVLERRPDAKIKVFEQKTGLPEGMRILYAILDKPGQLIQDASVPHAPTKLPAGIIKFKISREYNPFAQQARKVLTECDAHLKPRLMRGFLLLRPNLCRHF